MRASRARRSLLRRDAVKVMLQTRQHIEEGYSQAERGDLIDGDQAEREIQAMKITSRRDQAERR